MLAEADAPPITDVQATLAAAKKAVAATGETKSDESRRLQDLEIRRLVDNIVEPESTALQRAISDAAGKKIEEVRLSQVDTDSPSDDSHAKWMAARNALEIVAEVVITAPIATAGDAQIRAECFIDAVGRNTATGLPHDDNGDYLSLIAGYQEALAWLARREPDRLAWADAVAAYRRADRAVVVCYREEEGQDRAALVDPYERESLAARLKQALADRDAGRTALLGLEPPDVGGLLVQMELVMDRFGLGASVDTYAKRSEALGPGPITADVLWGGGDQDAILRRALALLATNSAKIRDRALPSDWQALLDEHGQSHPGFRDSLWHAYSAGLNASDLTAIRMDAAFGKHGPVLFFTTPNGSEFHAQADSLWGRVSFE